MTSTLPWLRPLTLATSHTLKVTAGIQYDSLLSSSRHRQKWFESRPEFWEILIASSNIFLLLLLLFLLLQHTIQLPEAENCDIFNVLINYCYSPPLAGGWRFLYRIQHEQKQHSIMVIMTTAATTPNITPSNNGSLQQWRNTVTVLNSNFRSLLLVSAWPQGISPASRLKFIFPSSTSTANDYRKNTAIKISQWKIYPVVPFFQLIS